MKDNRYTSVPIKKLPISVEWALKKATGEQLDFLNSIYEHHNFKSFILLVEELKYFCMHEVFNFQAKSAEELAYFRAKKGGELSSWVDFLILIQEAHNEIKIRKEKKY